MAASTAAPAVPAAAGPRAAGVPTQLLLTGVVRAGGVYELMDVRGNEMPAWRLRGADRMLYSSNTGKWVLGNHAEVEAQRFNSQEGIIRYPAEHRGSLPHELAGTWHFASEQGWRSDERIRFVAVPERVYVMTPSESLCSGVYALLSSLKNGMPAWACINSEKRLFLSVTSKWVVSDRQEQEQNTDKAFIRIPQPREGVLPIDFVCGWQWSDGAQWRNDPSICVKQLPRQLFVKVPARAELEGVFELAIDVQSEGMPVWRKASDHGDLCLVADRSTWVLRGEADRVMARNPREHNGCLPHHNSCTWQGLDIDGLWSDDVVVDIVELPKCLYVTVPSNPACDGAYQLSQARGCGLPVWREVSKDRVLFSGNSGKWVISDLEAEESDFDVNAGWVRFPGQNSRALPHMLPKNWQWADGNKWHSDGNISIDTSPPRLCVSAPTKMASSGIYELEDYSHNSLPVWRLRGKNRVMYVGTTKGKWIISTDDEYRSGGEMALIRYPTEHRGFLPHQLREGWQRSSSSAEWKKDNIRIRRVPCQVSIAAPSDQTCEGTYDLSKCLVNEMPVWSLQHEEEANRRHLYMGHPGKWIIGPSLLPERSTGWIMSAEAKTGELPHEVKLAGWQRAQGQRWTTDSCINVGAL